MIITSEVYEYMELTYKYYTKDVNDAREETIEISGTEEREYNLFLDASDGMIEGSDDWCDYRNLKVLMSTEKQRLSDKLGSTVCVGIDNGYEVKYL